MRLGRQHLVTLVIAGIALTTSAIGTISAASLAGAGTSPSAGTVSVSLLGLTARVPATWVSQPPASSMRLAQFRVPGARGSEDGELVVFHFGQGQGGSVEANIARWQSQFTSPDGQPVNPIVQRLTVSGMPVTTVELTGSYARGVGMGPQGAARPDQTLLVAIVETSKGNLTFQLHGASATVGANREVFLTMVRGIK